MRIVVTGASGFIGKHVVPFLEKSGVELLLVGRNPDKLKVLFPQHRATSYEHLETEGQGFDALVHLAVMNNNNKSQKLADFQEVNVTLLKTVFNSARIAGIKTFINTATIHAYNSRDRSLYAQTKREGEEALSNTSGISVINLRLPAVYGSTFAGKLAILSKVPRIFRSITFQFLASLKPTVNVNLVALEILNSAKKGVSKQTIISDRQNKNVVYHAMKRFLDISFALFVIIVLWWVLVIAWIAVKITTPGPGIFSHKRVGKNKIPFTIYKFRTMYEGTKQAGTHEVTADNVTKVGRFLRKTKIDELPQVWNILKNEISLIGARPCLPTQYTLIEARTELCVFDEIGGITGWAQIQKVDMSDPHRLAKLDAEYLVLRTIPLDLKIVLATAIGRGHGDNVK